MDAIPETLRSVTILFPTGNLEAEVLAAVARMTRAHLLRTTEVLPNYIRASGELYLSIILNGDLALASDEKRDLIQAAVSEYNPLWSWLNTRAEGLGSDVADLFGESVARDYDRVVRALKQNHFTHTVTTGNEIIYAINALRKLGRLRRALSPRRMRMSRLLWDMRRVYEDRLPDLRDQVSEFLTRCRGVKAPDQT
jgi:hypothetical protein